jgi:hypothetical protein
MENNFALTIRLSCAYRKSERPESCRPIKAAYGQFRILHNFSSGLCGAG